MLLYMLACADAGLSSQIDTSSHELHEIARGHHCGGDVDSLSPSPSSAFAPALRCCIRGSLSLPAVNEREANQFSLARGAKGADGELDDRESTPSLSRMQSTTNGPLALMHGM